MVCEERKAELRRVLLRLIAPNAALPEIDMLLLHDEWLAIDEMALQHRLQPLLYSAITSAVPVPTSIRVNWESAIRRTAIEVMAQRAEMADIVCKLRREGIETIALKGCWLGSYAWPAPEMRPMRDIDLMVTQRAQAEVAWDIVREGGWELGKPYEGAADGKELPELISPEGIALEIHRALWEDKQEAHRPMPKSDPAMLHRLKREDADDPALYLSEEDMFAHLVIHAAYSHWLDAGPLVLGDIDFLLQRWTPDWSQLWERAEREEWSRGAALMLALVDRWWRAGTFAASQCPHPAPEEIVEAAPDLLLQDLDHRRASRLVAEWDNRGGLIGRVLKHGAQPVEFAKKAMARAGELTDPEIRSQARQTVALKLWLESGQSSLA